MAIATLPLTHTAVNGTAPASSCPELQAQLWHITPDVARELLKNARPNRALSKARVRALIDDIRAGRWRVNGESIILDQDLRMIDGQHRCAAIAEAGIAVDVLVVVGVSPDVAMSIDQGHTKVGGDMLHMAGLDQAQTLATVARWLFRYERNPMRAVTVPLRHDALPAYVQARPSLPGSSPGAGWCVICCPRAAPRCSTTSWAEGPGAGQALRGRSGARGWADPGAPGPCRAGKAAARQNPQEPSGRGDPCRSDRAGVELSA